MRAFVTGATGFLGKFLTKALEKRGFSVIGIGSKECDLTKSNSLERFAKEPLTHIFHLAAWTQAGDFCLKHPAEQWLINQKINTHVIDFWASHHKNAKLIALGTSCSYPADGSPLIEENYFKGEPIASLFTYAMTKRMLLNGMRAMHQQYGMRYLNLIPSTLYGPNYHTDGRQMHFIFDLMRKIIHAKQGGKPPVLWGDGYQKRELIHVEDFVEIMLRLNDQVENTLINIGSGEEETIRNFAKIICDHTGYPFEKIEFDTSAFVGARSKVLIPDKWKTLLPDYELRPLKEGMGEVINWLEENSKLLVG